MLDTDWPHSTLLAARTPDIGCSYGAALAQLRRDRHHAGDARQHDRRDLDRAGLRGRLGGAIPLGLRAGRLSERQTEAILDGLLLNVYKAFDYREEEVIYDALARSASGDLLTELYLETRRSLELANQGGARAKVSSVDVVGATNEPLRGEKGFRTRATWNVSGSVGHWGHVHQRVNQYEAEITVRVIDDAWRVTELEVLQEERLQAPPVPAGSSLPPAGGM